MAEQPMTKQGTCNQIAALRAEMTLRLTGDPALPSILADIDAIAAWLAAACVPARGHWWTPGIAEHEDGGRFVAGEPPRCCLCGQRRAEEGGQ